MVFLELSDKKVIEYEKNQLVEVICQLRFPTILSIEAKEPAEFQETVRESFPRYMVQVETLPPAAPGAKQTTVNNYTFVSQDGQYKLSLTKSFIALSTLKYTNWDAFAGWLDEPLGQFISIYKPAYFERIGLRYVNGFSREKLGLAGTRWNELIVPKYLGALAEPDVDESSLTKCSVDIERKFDGKFALRLHAGPGHINRNVRTGSTIQSVQEQETRFLFDADLYAQGNIPIKESAADLGTVHSYADSVFADAITDKLHNAMEPTYVV